MVSIGGITYTDDWNTALAQNATLLGQRAAAMATTLGVGVEIDYEQNADPNLAGLQAFIDAYRAVHPYDATGASPTARLTIDLAAGDRWLIALTRKATADWLRTDVPVLDYANAMVPARQPRSAADAQANWQEHVDGKSQYSRRSRRWRRPSSPAACTSPSAASRCRSARATPSRFRRRPRPYVQSVASRSQHHRPGCSATCSGRPSGPSTRGIGTVPPNTCEGGMGVAASTLAIPVPMRPLRQQ